MMRAWPWGTPSQRAGISPAHAACMERHDVYLARTQVDTAVLTMLHMLTAEP